MQYGICHLSVVPVRNGTNVNDEMVTQLLYGDHFKVKERRKYYSRIQVAFDNHEGWINNKQYQLILESDFKAIHTKKEQRINTDFIAHVSSNQQLLLPILLGSRIDISKLIDHSFEGNATTVTQSKSNLVKTALLYLNSPYLSGGKTPFGIDASGLTQMVYKINGYKLFRETEKQASQGEPLSFIEESEPGDLVFFDDNDGIINHVGIILKDNYIIHAHGKVRIDRIDHTGIFNVQEKNYSHKLRVIKKIV
ncbi:C40 family peptidase [Croceitalea rosinachiae]|uniref:C40 family peptidase n=1 Tax=Croceitalea rosinachiae TaxID=3075596 RepID=A0ABU3AEQ3_9FLAO|nr:C40 family peptidase [Croceitalea sp. F388]MDT0608474.1 C40 family peptidase [Croceitalea sp. F388]